MYEPMGGGIPDGYDSLYDYQTRKREQPMQPMGSKPSAPMEGPPSRPSSLNAGWRDPQSMQPMGGKPGSPMGGKADPQQPPYVSPHPLEPGGGMGPPTYSAGGGSVSPETRHMEFGG